MDKKQSLSVIIPSFNGSKHLKDFLEENLKIIETYDDDIEVIVVDDKSTDDSISILSELSIRYPKLLYFKNSKKGACSARNLGVKNSKYNFLFFIDNDVLLTENYLSNAKRYLNNDTFAVACSGYNFYTKMQQDGIKLLTWKNGYPRFTKNILNDKLNIDNKYESFGVQGAYFFCSKKHFNILNGFDEDLFEPYLLEESDLFYRGLKRGWKIDYAPNLIAYHKTGGTIASKTNPRTKILSKRNRLLFVWKNITNNYMLLSHIFFTIIYCFNPKNFIALKEALTFRKIVLQKRKKEKNDEKVSDRDILRQSKELSNKFK